MPSIIPSHIYMLLAMTIIGTLLVFSFNSFASTLRFVPEKEQLYSIVMHVAAKAAELTILTTSNSTAKILLNLPISIGDRQYWIRLQNNTYRSWVEGGFGETITDSALYKVSITGKPSATGSYISSSGTATLKCHMNESVVHLVLTNGG